MKNLITYIFIIYSFYSTSQIGIESSFNVVATGRNQSLIVTYKVNNKFTINGGVKNHFNKPNNFPNARIFKKNFHALNIKDRLGFEIGSTYQVWKRENITFNIFYMFQFTKSNLRHDWIYAIGSITPNPQSEEDFVYIRIINDNSDVTAYENNFGININISITKHMYLIQKFGGGIIIYPQNKSMNVSPKSFTWELSETISFGLGYKFK